RASRFSATERHSTRCIAFTRNSIVASRFRFTRPGQNSMNATGIPLKEPAISAVAGDTEQLERAYIDASTRVPVLMFYTSAMAWLILGTLLAGFVSFKLHSPDLLSNISFLTWGRVRRPHERDGLRLGVHGWNGNRDLVDGAIVPDRAAISAVARCGRLLLEFGR